MQRTLPCRWLEPREAESLTIIRNFVPDSGRLTLLQTPQRSETVRVDAGFVAGDEVSAHYDPMIAKLIAAGPTRAIAIQKLRTALQQYEIAGVITNIDFLKKVCNNPAFGAGDLETGFIDKHKDELFADAEYTPEVFAQAAIGSFLADAIVKQEKQGFLPANPPGFGSATENRIFCFELSEADGRAKTIKTKVVVNHLGIGMFDLTVDGHTYNSTASTWDSQKRTVTTYYPHTRLTTRLMNDNGNLTLFQAGQQYRLRCAPPSWAEKALGIRDTAHSVLAPMPCKILKVEAKKGDSVKKDQVLVVIESMKMETVIRSPQDGVVSRIAHPKGESVKSGEILVEFEDSEMTS